MVVRTRLNPNADIQVFHKRGSRAGVHEARPNTLRITKLLSQYRRWRHKRRPVGWDLHYAPEKGFAITVIDDGQTITGSRLTAPAEGMFVFCASLECSENRAIDFGRYCVEINDSETILRRLRTRASAASNIDYERAHMGPTVYRPLDQIPGVDWAFPDRVVLIKPPEYAHQNEFRIVLPMKANRKPSGDYISLIIGNLAGVTKLHTFN